jgi:hypothetical protein
VLDGRACAQHSSMAAKEAWLDIIQTKASRWHIL